MAEGGEVGGGDDGADDIVSRIFNKRRQAQLNEEGERTAREDAKKMAEDNEALREGPWQSRMTERNQRQEVRDSRPREYVGNKPDLYQEKADDKHWAPKSKGMTRRAYETMQGNDRPLSQRPGKRMPLAFNQEESNRHVKVETAKSILNLRNMKKPNLPEAEGGMVGDDEDDMVARIMRKRSGYSEGGQVANDEKILADFEPNEFDDLALDDDLESSYDGANSGDEIGNERTSQDERDIVARIMRSRGKRDRNPRPA